MRATSVPILVFLGLSVLDLYPCTRQTDRSKTDVRQHHRLMPPYSVECEICYKPDAIADRLSTVSERWRQRWLDITCCVYRHTTRSSHVHHRSLETWRCCHWELSSKARLPKKVSWSFFFLIHLRVECSSVFWCARVECCAASSHFHPFTSCFSHSPEDLSLSE